ncbi:MAG: serine/threonine-protein kinase [Labilithrix sp.]
MSGRYNIIGTLASGGMGTVYLARMTGSAGFSRLVAIKRLHPHHASDPQLVAMLVDEGRLASQLRHVNIIDTLDLVAAGGAFGLVLEYVEGAALGTLMDEARALGEEVPRPIAIAILRGMLRGLDAAHEATGADGSPLGIVHRDVSPQNVLVGADGVPRLIDFGIAKAMGRLAPATQTGQVRGKFAYMAPEQLLERPVTRQTDVYSAGVMTWQLLTGRLPFESDDARVVMARVMTADVPAPSTARADVSPELDAIVAKATAREPADRYAHARDLYEALAIETAASDEEVGAWVRRVGAAQIAKQKELQQTVPTDPSRSVEELLTDPARAVPGALAPAPRRRTWLVLPIAAAIGSVGVIAGLRAAPEPSDALAAATPFPPPPPLPTATTAPSASASPIDPPPITLTRPPIRRSPRVRVSAAPAPPPVLPPAPAPSPPAPTPDHDLDHR